VIILDTHAWLWWVVSAERLSEAAREAIDRTSRIGVPTIACFEVGTLAARARIRVKRPVDEWIRQALAHPRVEEVPLSAEIAIQAAALDRDAFPGDPADRIVYATALAIGAPLLSADRAIKAFDPARVVW
jgi:PIN domain nuclease of toxin-antitoxin system